jgi:TonB-linked SusC/RagA family outer membrane protein
LKRNLISLLNLKLLKIMRKSTLWKSGVMSLLLLSFAISLAYAQARKITGTVTSEEEGPLPGVSVVIVGTTQGTITNAEGNYSIDVPNQDAVLQFSFVGLKTQALAVGTQSVINVVLISDLSYEIVVTAYTQQRKQDLTGAVGIVTSDELIAIPQGQVTQQLQGRVAGVTVTQDVRPGENAKVRIRGFGSFQDNDPLYVVDGVPTTEINTISPEDIESLTVLKDAGAASIYGARASNGVILITTKKGQQGMQVNYNMYIGSQNPGPGPDFLLNTKEYADLQWLVYANDGTVEEHPIYGPSSGTPTLPTWAADTKWWDEVTNNALIMNHDLSLSGGNQNARYYASVGYFDQDGITIENWHKRYSARFNSDFTIKNRVTIGENANIVHRSGNGTNSNDSENSALMNTYRSQPIIPVVWNTGDFQGTTHLFKDGDWGGTGIAQRLGNSGNFVAAQTRDKYDKDQSFRFLGNIYADVKIIEGLNFRTSFGGSLRHWFNTDWTGATYEQAENVATSSYREYSGYEGDWTWTNTLTLNKQFGDHYILAVGGYEAIKMDIHREVNAGRAAYFSDSFSYRTVTNGATIQYAESDFYTPRTLVSQFLRADYNFQSKYYLSGTIRRDGASVFGSDTRYGIFPSVSAGWRISGESFMSGLSWITDLKIRGGYGTMGNQLPVSPENQFFLYGGTAGESYYDISGTGNSSVQGYRPTRMGNPEAKWETNVTTNIGFDAVMLERQLEVHFDYYSKHNKDLLFDPELPAVAGVSTYPFVNIGEMKNKGIDLQLIYRHTWSDFNLEANAQFTTYNNKIVKIAEGFDYFDAGGYSRIGTFNRNILNHEMGEFFGYNVTGLFQEADFNADSLAIGKYYLLPEIAAQVGAEPGFLRYEDVDGDGEITTEDRKSIGNPNPDFTYGLNLVLGYKAFDLSAFFYGSQGNEIFNYNKWWLDFWPSFQGQKSTDLLNNSWTPANTDAPVPKASNTSNFSTNTVASSYYVEPASFFRLKNLQLGYRLPKTLLGNVFSSARVYVQGINLFTITKYTGMDPELASFDDTYFGVDQGNLPAVKQFLVGVSLGF